MCSWRRSNACRSLEGVSLRIDVRMDAEQIAMRISCSPVTLSEPTSSYNFKPILRHLLYAIQLVVQQDAVP